MSMQTFYNKLSTSAQPDRSYAGALAGIARLPLSQLSAFELGWWSW
jgi:hypothetical protein